MMVGRAQGIGAKSKLTTLECSSRRGRTDHLFPPLLGPTESPKLTQESHSQRWDLNSGPPTPRPHCTCCSRGSELTRATVQYPITKGVTGHHHLTDGNPGLRERLAWEAESGPDPWTPSSVVLGEGPFFCLWRSNGCDYTSTPGWGHVSPRSPLFRTCRAGRHASGAASATQSPRHAGRAPSMDPAHWWTWAPSSETTHGEGSQAALTDVGSVIADQEFVPGLPLRTAPCSPSSSRGSPPAASCWPWGGRVHQTSCWCPRWTAGAGPRTLPGPGPLDVGWHQGSVGQRGVSGARGQGLSCTPSQVWSPSSAWVLTHVVTEAFTTCRALVRMALVALLYGWRATHLIL